MRTTVDLPDTLFRRTKALAALRGTSMKELVIHAVEKEIGETSTNTESKKARLPQIRLKHGKKLDLTNFDFDDLLG